MRLYYCSDKLLVPKQTILQGFAQSSAASVVTHRRLYKSIPYHADPDRPPHPTDGHFKDAFLY